MRHRSEQRVLGDGEIKACFDARINPGKENPRGCNFHGAQSNIDFGPFFQMCKSHITSIFTALRASLVFRSRHQTRPLSVTWIFKHLSYETARRCMDRVILTLAHNVYTRQRKCSNLQSCYIKG